jgi:hypothetical protein
MWTRRTEQAPVTTCWRADEIVVTQGAARIDHLPAGDIERVTLIHGGAGESPGEVRAALFELTERAVWLGAPSGITGSVLFERQAYWSHRNCIYWVSEASVAWPTALGATRWPFGRSALAQHQRLSRADAALLFDRTAVTGPHTWDQRKQYRIERRRPFPGFMSHHGRAVDARPTAAV